MSPDQLRPTTYYPTVVGSILADLRKSKGLKQAELAERVGVNQSAWSKIERGATPINVEQLADAAEQLGTSPGQLLNQADQLARYARERGVHVENQRFTNKELLAAGAVLLGSAALGALIGAALSRDD